MSSVQAALTALRSAVTTRLAAATWPIGWAGTPLVEDADPSDDEVPEQGLVVIPPGAVTFEIVAFGPVYEAKHRVSVMVYVRDTDASKRDTVRDTIVKEICSLATLDQSLGGAIETMDIASNDRDNLGASGSEVTDGALIAIEMTYTTTSPAA